MPFFIHYKNAGILVIKCAGKLFCCEKTGLWGALQSSHLTHLVAGSFYFKYTWWWLDYVANASFNF